MGMGNLYFIAYHMPVLFPVYIWVTVYGAGQSCGIGNVGANCIHVGRRVWISGTADAGDVGGDCCGVGGFCINKQVMESYGLVVSGLWI